ncbi:hypothetical protein TCAL_15590 [Tigriopus californicus]|uniref:Uncharacterized protein n=1 Tax=Tigriopus californicus TaxID=6832 RepID=A0A553PBG2_TIGCA|nr:hypothetical protein TCAL_15590 [Tigriopus californicus]
MLKGTYPACHEKGRFLRRKVRARDPAQGSGVQETEVAPGSSRNDKRIVDQLDAVNKRIAKKQAFQQAANDLSGVRGIDLVKGHQQSHPRLREVGGGQGGG